MGLPQFNRDEGRSWSVESEKERRERKRNEEEIVMK
jgi:hypothetical protein